MRKILIYGSMILLISCDDDSNSLDNNAIDSKIIITISENLRANHFDFRCRTEKYYDCGINNILTQQENSHNEFKVTFTGIEQTHRSCDMIKPPFTHADAFFYLTNLANGNYSIELNNASLKNRGLLKITDTEIILDFIRLNGIEITNPVLKRVPTNTYWGTIQLPIDNGRAETRVKEFLTDIKTLGASFNKQIPGDYGHYKIDQNGEIITKSANSELGAFYVKSFIFQFAGDEEAFKAQLKSLILSLRQEDYRSITNIENYEGEII